MLRPGHRREDGPPGGGPPGLSIEEPSAVAPPAYMHAPDARRSSVVSGPIPPAEFAPNDFQYNARLWLFFAPCFLVVVAFGGRTVVATVVIGLMFSYILDYLDQREGTLISWWLTMAATAVGIFIAGIPMLRHSWTALLLLYNMSLLCMLAGVWGTLQFKWVQKQMPAAALLMERLLLALFPYATSTTLAWAASVLSAPTAAPLLLLLLLFAAAALYGVPLRSSFRLVPPQLRDAPPGDPRLAAAGAMVLGRRESAAQAAVFAVAPAAVHAALYRRALLASWVRLAETGALLALPPLLLLALAPRGALWWTGLGGAGQGRLAKLVLLAHGSLLVLSLEARVVFHTFAHLVPFAPPLSYALVTAACFSAALLAAALVLPVFGTALLRRRAVVTPLAVATALAASAVLRLPLHVAALPPAGAWALARFLFTRRPADYAVFAGCALGAGAHVLHASYGAIELRFAVLPLAFPHFLALLAATAAASLALPLALLSQRALAPAGPGAPAPPTRPLRRAGALLVAQAAGLALAELLLASQFPGAYSPYFVLLTSALGLALAHRLEAQGRCPPGAAWLAACLHAAKLAPLLAPLEAAALAARPRLAAASPAARGAAARLASGLAGAGELESLGAALALALAVSPVLVHERLSRAPMSTPRGLFHAAAIAAVAWATRGALPARLAAIALGARPAGPALAALVLLLCGAAYAPLAVRHLPHVPALRRLSNLLLIAGALLALLQPDPDPASLLALLAPAPAPRAASAAASAAAARRLAGASAWLLLFSAGATGAAAAGFLPVARSAAARVAYGLLAGPPLGLFVAIRFVARPASAALPLLFAALAAALALLFLFALYPSPRSVRLLPLLYGAYMLALPFACAAAPFFFPAASRSRLREHVQGARLVLVAAYAAANVLFALLLRVTAAPAPARPGGRPAGAGRAGPHAGLGNAACVAGFCLAALLSVHFLGASGLSLLLLTPLLLLLSPGTDGGGPLFLHSLSEEARYGPPAAAAAAALLLAALHDLAPLALSPLKSEAWLAAKEGALLLCGLPAAYLVVRFLWSRSEGRASGELAWLLLAPPAVLPAVLAELAPVRALGLAAGPAAAISFAYARHVRIKGLQYL